MASRDQKSIDITPQVLLKAYSCGIFPMAENADDPALYWIEPQQRGVLPLSGIHLSSRMAQTVRNTKLQIKIDTDFVGVIDGCAAPRPGRRTTWINGRIRELYTDLFKLGHCHTVEAWNGDELVGGLYGVALHGAFFGESMFSTVRDASKIALLHLSARLIQGDFLLLDTQFVTDHLRQFGAREVDRGEFQALLEVALQRDADFLALPRDVPPEQVVAIIDAAARKAP